MYLKLRLIYFSLILLDYWYIKGIENINFNPFPTVLLHICCRVHNFPLNERFTRAGYNFT